MQDDMSNYDLYNKEIGEQESVSFASTSTSIHKVLNVSKNKNIHENKEKNKHTKYETNLSIIPHSKYIRTYFYNNTDNEQELNKSIGKKLKLVSSSSKYRQASIDNYDINNGKNEEELNRVPIASPISKQASTNVYDTSDDDEMDEQDFYAPFTSNQLPNVNNNKESTGKQLKLMSSSLKYRKVSTDNYNINNGKNDKYNFNFIKCRKK
ncbi:PREDICTED: uncharacterized protein LOC108782432 [Cyphomyrmex costatus]|uniref:uncharacterized protein LOC108782432 n=1 Tax=Cyphomyrmex costatus TaxID=456900 RepID=UPI0008522A82|nr:PREDICTED: uncharacterized protein LOC108782432 [Cyphomyrmex costatus]